MNIMYKAVCKICAAYKEEHSVENAINEVQRGVGKQPLYSIKQCENGKHDLLIFEIEK